MSTTLYILGSGLCFLSLYLQFRLYRLFPSRNDPKYFTGMFIACLLNVMCDALFLVGNLMQQNHFWSLWFGLLVIGNILSCVYFWRKRPPRKRVRKWLGAKAKALKAKLVEAARKLQPAGNGIPVPA